MHELSITQSILDTALEVAQKNSARKVTQIHLTIGRLSSIVDDCVQFYWDHISKGTLCEGAVLHFQRLPARMRCKDCGWEYNLTDDLVPCPACKSINLEIVSGDQLLIESIDILGEDE